MVLLAVFLLTSSALASSAQQQAGEQQTVVARVRGAGESPVTGQLVVMSENQSAVATIVSSSETQRQIAILIDAGPSQSAVFPREAELAVSLVKALSAPGTNFLIGKIGLTGQIDNATPDQAVAIQSIQDIVCETGKPTDVPIYDLTAAAIRKLSEAPGIRVVIFIGGGKDKGSHSSYEIVRNLAQARHVTVFTLLLADRSHRGPRSMLSHGWWMRELADETAGIFLENEKSPKALERVTESIRAIRLITFHMDFKGIGRHRISLRLKGDLRFRAQKAVFLETENR